MLAVGCGFYPDLYGPGMTEAKLAVVLEELDVLDPVAPPEPTNAFADDANAASLGQKYFFEPGYSETGAISCATCHDPASGFQDARDDTSLGLAYTGRHAPSCLNAAVGRGADDTNWQMWDGRMDSLWAQALGPPESPVEMGGTRSGIALMIYDRYRAEHESVFGPMPELRDADGTPRIPLAARPGDPEWEALSEADKDTVNGIYAQFGKAISSYERLLISTNSAFDLWYAEVDAGGEGTETLSSAALRGLELFVGKANCVACHNGANFTDQSFHNLGIRQEGLYIPSRDPGRAEGIGEVMASEWNCASKWSDHPSKSECVVLSLSDSTQAEGAFKTPTLRNIASTAPYMHTGGFETLEDVVEFYDRGGDTDGFTGIRDPEIVPLHLTDREREDLVAFLESLTGEQLPLDLLVAPDLPE